jgi:hypothetical protein
MPRGKPGTGPHSGKGDQNKKVTYNLHYIKYGKPNHPGTNKKAS